MSIKLKMLTCNMIMVITCTIFFLLDIWTINYYFSMQLYKEYDMIPPKEKAVRINSYVDVKAINLRNFDEIRGISIRTPELFKDQRFLEELNKNFEKNNCYIIIEKDNQITFNGMNKENLDINKLLQFNYESRDKAGRYYIEGNFIIRQIEFYNSDGKGSVFTVTDTTKFYTIVKSSLTIGIISLILIIALVSTIFTLVMSRAILNPLKSLKNSTDKIKNGELDFKVQIDSKDEIGDLCYAFDSMREKLKESLDVQNQYESNRKELISNISHDLKTPITSIKGYVEGIRDGIADNPEKMKRYIETIHNKAVSMDKLIDELFLYSKLDLNKVPFNFEAVDIEAYMQDIVEELQFELEKKYIEISFQYNYSKKILVKMDREKINRVINNIIGNSVKYMDRNSGKIDIDLSGDEESVVLTIKDNGKGISRDAIPLVFNRFYREDSARTSKNGGSGLGLAICEKIIKEHGGEIWLESERNKGTSVSFKLEIINIEKGEYYEENINY